LLFDSGYIERYGFGIKMIEEEVSSHPFCSVEFKASPSSFTVIFRKDITSLLDEMDNQILKLVQVPTKSGEIAVRLNVSKNTILKRIDKLKKSRTYREERIRSPDNVYGNTLEYDL
jgi:ATP-dependent DNA helicase RecG